MTKWRSCRDESLAFEFLQGSQSKDRPQAECVITATVLFDPVENKIIVNLLFLLQNISGQLKEFLKLILKTKIFLNINLQ